MHASPMWLAFATYSSRIISLCTPPCLSISPTMRVSVKVQGLALLVLLLASASLTLAAAPAYDKPPGEPPLCD